MSNNKEANSGYITYLRLLRYATPYWMIFILGALAMLIYALTDTGFAFLIKTLTDSFADKTSNAELNQLKFYLPVAVIVIFLSGVFQVFSQFTILVGSVDRLLKL